MTDLPVTKAPDDLDMRVGAVAAALPPLRAPGGHEARPPAPGREARDGGAEVREDEREACQKCGGPAAPPAPLLTAEDVLEMEIGAGERRILRELLRAGERGLSEREVLTALYIKWRDCARRVERGMRQSYVKKVLRDLRSALEDCGVHVVAIEYAGRRPVRWMVTSAAEPEVPQVPLPHVVSEPRLLAALHEMTRMQNILVRRIAATAERGLGSRELVELTYPDGVVRPQQPENAISASLSEARVVLARHHLAIVTRPAAGPRVRRYLVRTR